MNTAPIDHRAIIASLSASDRAVLTGLTNATGRSALRFISARSCCSVRQSLPAFPFGR
jgi:hypothetical protein